MNATDNWFTRCRRDVPPERLYPMSRFATMWIVPISVAVSYIFQHQHKKSAENVTHKQLVENQ